MGAAHPGWGDRPASPAVAEARRTEPSRRRLLAGAAALASFGCLGVPRLAAAARLPLPASPRAVTPDLGLALFDEAMRDAVPPDGFRSRIALGDSVVRLAAAGVIDRDRLAASYRTARGGDHAAADPAFWLPPPAPVRDELPASLRRALDWPSARPIHLTAENAGHYLMLLWPLGLANFMAANATSPINGPYLDRLASTAGWTLGREPSGAAYFNGFPIVPLTAEQEATVVRVAETIFRPCCNNSTFYQDCNHGSALLGLLELGVAQGLDEPALYREALAINAMWFPAKYVQTVMYFKVIEQIDWPDLPPAVPLGYRYSAIDAWRGTVRDSLARIPNLPKPESRTSCSI